MTPKTTEQLFWEMYAIMQDMAEQFRQLSHTKSLPTPDYVTQYVANRCNVSVDEITTRSRKQDIAEARQLLSALLKIGLRLSARQVGTMVGNYNHATVLHSINKVSTRYAIYPMYRNSVDKMIERLFSEDQDYVKARIKDPHLDSRDLYAKFKTA